MRYEDRPDIVNRPMVKEAIERRKRNEPLGRDDFSELELFHIELECRKKDEWFEPHIFTKLWNEHRPKLLAPVGTDKTGDFVEAMLSGAQDVNEYAFAIGALCHYASDHEGHAVAVNKAVPLIYPKMRQKFGDVVPYDKAPKQHILVEFAFDVLLVAHGGYQLQAYHDFIGFKVAKPALERAVRATYGLEMKDLFLDHDLAIGTFRHAVGKMIPDVTKVAWEKKQDQIQKITPGVVRDRFVLTLPRVAYEKEFGKDYQKPGAFARVLGFLYKLLPKIGPLRPLAFKVPTPEAEKLFLDSLLRTRQRFGTELRALSRGPLQLANVNLDTGKPIARGEYALADETARELDERLLKSKLEEAKPTKKSKVD